MSWNYPIANVQNLINQQVFHDRLDNWTTYRTDCEYRRAMLEGDFIGVLGLYIRKHYGEKAWLKLVDRFEILEYQNLLADVIARTMQVYAKPARRRLLIDPNVSRERDPRDALVPELTQPEDDDDGSGTEAIEYMEDPVFNEVIAGLDYDATLDQVQRYMGALGLAFIRPWVRRGKLRLQVATPDSVDAIRVAWDDPKELTGISYSLTYPHDTTKPATRHFHWDMEGLFLAQEYGKLQLDNVTLTQDLRDQIKAEWAGVVEVDEHGQMVPPQEDGSGSRVGPEYRYRRDDEPYLPWVVAAYNAPPDKLMNEFEGRDLFDATLRVGKLEVEKAWLITHQSHKQPVLLGVRAADIGDQFLDPTSAILIPHETREAEVKWIDLKSSPKEYNDEIDQIKTTVLVRRGMSLDEFKSTAARRSAEAINIENEGKRAHWSHVATAMGHVEHALIETITVVWNADGDGRKISENGTSSVDFADPYQPNVMVAYETLKALLKDQVISTVDLVLLYNPDIENREEAMDQIKRSIKEMDEIKSFGGAPEPEVPNGQPGQSPGPGDDERQDLQDDPSGADGLRQGQGFQQRGAPGMGTESGTVGGGAG